jgi:hypothetical protein
MKVKTPFPVTGMLWTVLFLAAWNALRLISALADWSALAEFAPRPGPLYVAVTASFWTLACLAVARAIRRRYVHAQGWYALILMGYAAWWWADRVFLFDQPRPNWPFAVGVTALVLFDAINTFFDKKITAYFTKRESHDQQPSHQQTS